MEPGRLSGLWKRVEIGWCLRMLEWMLSGGTGGVAQFRYSRRTPDRAVFLSICYFEKDLILCICLIDQSQSDVVNE